MSDGISWFYNNAEYLQGYTFTERGKIIPLEKLSVGYDSASIATPGDIFKSELMAKEGFLAWKKRQISYLSDEISRYRKELDEFKKIEPK